MPQLIFKGIKEQQVQDLSIQLPKNLAELTGIRQDWFSIEYQNHKFFLDGKEVESYPVINVYWFDRGQELQDKVAEEITKTVKTYGYEMVDVIFNLLEEKNYYENGTHF